MDLGFLCGGFLNLYILNIKNVTMARCFLMERNNIVAMHVKILRKMHDLKLNNDTHLVVYLDET